MVLDRVWCPSYSDFRQLGTSPQRRSIQQIRKGMMDWTLSVGDSLLSAHLLIVLSFVVLPCPALCAAHPGGHSAAPRQRRASGVLCQWRESFLDFAEFHEGKTSHVYCNGKEQRTAAFC